MNQQAKGGAAAAPPAAARVADLDAVWALGDDPIQKRGSWDRPRCLWAWARPSGLFESLGTLDLDQLGLGQAQMCLGLAHAQVHMGPAAGPPVGPGAMVLLGLRYLFLTRNMHPQRASTCRGCCKMAAAEP